VYTSSTVASDTVHSTQGCDSVYNVHNIVVTTIVAVTNNFNHTGCNKVTYLGVDYFSSTIVRNTVHSYQGCDSVYNVHNIIITKTTASSNNHTTCSSYLWNGTTYTTSGTYIYRTTNAQGCDSNATLVLVITQPTTSTTNTSICPAALPYVWNTRSFAAAGSYVVHLTNSQGCDSSAMLNLNLLLQPTISLQDTFRVWLGNQITLNSAITNSIAFKWYPKIFLDYDSIEKPICFPLYNQKYNLIATSIDGCEATRNTYVKLYKDLLIVNAFSPNGDGINDVWDLSVLSDFSNITVKVFDRGGNVVFESRGYSKPWNGTRNGQPLPIGTYYYVIDVPNYKKMGGSITILR
jgi:gliding motility-associated-like protein